MSSGRSREGAWGVHPPPPLFWGKKEEITERRKAGRARETTPCEITLRIPRNS